MHGFERLGREIATNFTAFGRLGWEAATDLYPVALNNQCASCVDTFRNWSSLNSFNVQDGLTLSGSLHIFILLNVQAALAHTGIPCIFFLFNVQAYNDTF